MYSVVRSSGAPTPTGCTVPLEIHAVEASSLTAACSLITCQWGRGGGQSDGECERDRRKQNENEIEEEEEGEEEFCKGEIGG